MDKKCIKNKIALKMLESSSPLTVSLIAEEFSLSGKTVRNYIKEIKNYFSLFNVKLMVKPGIGIFVESEKEEDIWNIKRKLLKCKEKGEMYSPLYRRNYILKTLLESTIPYTIALFAEDLYVSTGTISKDLDCVKDFLEDHNLKLNKKQNQGIWIEGDESYIRNSIMDLFFQIKSDECSEDEKEELNSLDYRVEYDNYKKIKNLIPKIQYFKIQSIVQQAENDLNYCFTDQAFINIIIHIAITIERVKSKKEINISSDFYEMVHKNEFEFKIAAQMVDKIYKELGVKFPDAEIAFISLHILGAKIQHGITYNDYKILVDTENKEYKEMADEMIALVSNILNVNLLEDELLRIALILHLRPTIIKVKYGLNLENPLLKRIKEEYTSIFGAVWACNSIFEKRIGVSINEDEIAYIALHFAVAIDRRSSKVKTIVVCSSGMGTSQLVAGRLSKKLKELDIISILSANQISETTTNNCDLIISTIPLNFSKKPVVRISTLVDEVDIINISNAVGKINTLPIIDNQKDVIEIYDENLMIFEEKLCFIEDRNLSFEEIVRYYGGLMGAYGYVKEGYCHNVIEREKKASTYIGKGICIPHSREDFVNKSKVCIIKLKNPLMMEDYQVSLIVMLALSFKEVSTITSFFKNFYSMLENDDLIKKIAESENEKQIFKLFINGGK